MKRFLLLLLVLLLLCPAAMADPGEDYTSYESFIGRYAGNLDFINENEGRRLINLIFASGDTQGQTRVFRIEGDILNAQMYTMTSQRRIVGLMVTLTAPADMATNDASRQDFTTSGYQCYALLMAMRGEEKPAERFGLITELNNGVRYQEKYSTFVGPYTLTARRKAPGSMEFTFSSVFWNDPNVLTDQTETGESEQESPEELLPDSDGNPMDYVFNEEETGEDSSLAG